MLDWQWPKKASLRRDNSTGICESRCWEYRDERASGPVLFLIHLSQGLEPVGPGLRLQQQAWNLSQRGCLVNSGSLSLMPQGHFFGVSLGVKGLPFGVRLPGFKF